MVTLAQEQRKPIQVLAKANFNKRLAVLINLHQQDYRHNKDKQHCQAQWVTMLKHKLLLTLIKVLSKHF